MGLVPDGGASATSIMPLLTLPDIQSCTMGVTSRTMNDPFCNWVDETLKETVATALQRGVVVPVTVLAVHSGVAANSQTVTVPGLPPPSTNRIRLAF
jgi:hypothetical protein